MTKMEKESNKRKWGELLLITELFKRYYEGKSTEKEKMVIENLDLELNNKPDLRVLKSDAKTENIWNKISAELKLETYARKKRKKNYRLALAASLALLVTLGYWKFTNGTKNAALATKNVFKEPQNKIKVGTDKATLTLADGTQVALEKGKNFTKGAIKSNGSKIRYQNNQNYFAKDSASSVLTHIPNNYLSIPRGGQFFIELADGTKVWLNSETQLKYPVYFKPGESRVVELVYGEAYFDVSPSSSHQGADFKVVNAAQEITVLGTEFNIKAYKNETLIYTTLVEGKVAVNTDDNTKLLAPEQQAILNLKNQKIAVKSVDVYNAISWKEGVFSFKGTPLAEIMTVLSRWYDITVVFEKEALKQTKFNGVIRKNQELEQVLSIIQQTGFIQAYKINGKTINIK